MRNSGRGALLAAALAALPLRAVAVDSASLQFTVPAPDPAPAGDVVSFQVLSVNSGTTQWSAGAYYWVAEIYDLDYHMIARTDQVSPSAAVPPGSVAAITLTYRIPETFFGRRLYRVFLVKDSKTLIQSDYTGFQIVEKPIPPPPDVVTYHMEGNLTTSMKYESDEGGKNATGATTFNTTGKIRENSYLINLYILHQQGDVFNPFTIVANFYAPWGTIYGGDISPNLGPLSVSGQGMRGVMLEQKKGPWDWDVLGGRTITSQAGTATTNGRYERSLYAGKLGLAPAATVKANLSYFISSDEQGSLSADPNSNNFRGPSLLAQKNSGYGLDVSWEPVPKLRFLSAYQTNTYWADVDGPSVVDKAERAEFNVERKLFRLHAYVQRAGANFVAFDNPSIVGDRMTYDAQFTYLPTAWYTFTLGGDQYRTNLANDPTKTTTTQRIVNVTNALNLKSGTSLGVNASLNTALGDPSSVLNNKTTTVGFNVGQAIGKHHVSLNFQDSQFRDANGLADDLDTLTEGFSSNWKLPRNWSLTFGVTESDTNDKTNGSKRTSTTIGPSLSVPLKKNWTGQFWGTWNATKNTSPTMLVDTKQLSLNSEYTWAYSKQANVTFGIGGNMNKDAINPGNTYNDVTGTFRYSYTF